MRSFLELKKKSDCKICDSVGYMVLPSDLEYREIDCWHVRGDVVKQTL